MPAKKVQSSKLKVKSLETKASKVVVKKAAPKKEALVKTVKPASKAVKSTAAVKTKGSSISRGISAKMLDLEGKEAGTINLPSEIFDVKVSPHLLAQAVRVYLANQRSGTASTKTRGEVR